MVAVDSIVVNVFLPSALCARPTSRIETGNELAIGLYSAVFCY
jgi:hypothetical protein